MADSGLHARLHVGQVLPMRQLVGTGQALHALLASAGVQLMQGERRVDQGRGALVLDSPLQALLHFVTELRHCPGAPDITPGDIVTTGTWTDAWPVAPGQTWSSAHDDLLPPLSLRLA
jgi:2-oxo-3-hexenedioate decarboxylase